VSPYQRNLQGYRKIHVGTASPGKLLLMVYEGTLKFLRTAKMLMEKNQSGRASVYILKAASALIELISCLDFDKSPEIADTLKNLYVCLLSRLRNALQDNSIKEIEETINILGTLKDSWEEAFLHHNAELLKAAG